MSHENVEIIEGFLCPICYEDLGTILGLHSHFNDKHGEEKDILSAFKGISFYCLISLCILFSNPGCIELIGFVIGFPVVAV